MFVFVTDKTNNVDPSDTKIDLIAVGIDPGSGIRT
jgi:hypothetical protein